MIGIPSGTIDGSLVGRSGRIVQDGRTYAYVLQAGEPELRVTQNDVRQIQKKCVL